MHDMITTVSAPPPPLCFQVLTVEDLRQPHHTNNLLQPPHAECWFLSTTVSAHACHLLKPALKMDALHVSAVLVRQIQ